MLRLGEPERGGPAPSRVQPDPNAKRPSMADSVTATAWPDEVRDWLEQLNREATNLRAERRQLLGRVAALEKQLTEATARHRDLTTHAANLERALRRRPEPTGREDNWLSSVADRTAHALRTGQEAAHRIVEQARERAAQIEQRARQEAAQLYERAEAEAQKIVMVAQYDAEGILQAAHASGEELLRHAARLRDESIAELGQRKAALQAEVRRLQETRGALLESFVAIKESAESVLKSETAEPSTVTPGGLLPQRFAAWLRRGPGSRALNQIPPR